MDIIENKSDVRFNTFKKIYGELNWVLHPVNQICSETMKYIIEKELNILNKENIILL